MSKLTRAQLESLARAAGLTLTADPDGIAAATTIHNLRAELAEVVRAREDYIGQCRRLERERDAARAEITRMRSVAGRITIGADVEGLATMSANLAEARAEVDALKRTVAKLREAADPRTPSPAAQAALLAPPKPAAAQTVLVIRFTGPQGYGTADRLRAVGARWKWDPKNPDGSPSKTGAWTLPLTPEAEALVETLRTEGRTIAACYTTA